MGNYNKSMTTTKIILTVLFTGFLANPILFAQSKAADAIPISKDDYIPNFLSIHKTVKKRYSHLNSKKIDLDLLAEQYSSQIKGIVSKEDYIKVLLKYFAELHNAHTSLILNAYRANCSAKLVENVLFLNRVEENELLEEGIAKYDEIIKIDDIPAIDWLENEKKYLSAATAADLDNRVVFRVFSNEFQVPRKYEIKTKKGVKAITLQLNKLGQYKAAEEPKAKSSIINDSIGYMEIISMSGDVVTDFLKEYTKIKHLPYLILDIRRNGGGNSNNSEKLASYFFSKPNRACVSRRNIQPNRDHYQGKLILLISENTFSAAESFALDIKENTDAVLIGSQTGRDTGNRPRVFTSKYGFSFRIPTRKPPQVSFAGFPMEGRGINPHLEAKLTIDDYLQNIDTVFQRAINYVERDNQNSRGSKF